MKNLKCFPFERNRYFYGKLLTVNDFESEQKYFNDKRRTINRFLFGCGVVSGMEVTRTDDNTITIGMGLALDFSGREIIIDSPVIKRLSMLDGFDSDSSDNQESGYMYLCIDYAETEKEPVHSIASSGVKPGENGEFNKLAEGYRLYLTTQEPLNDGLTSQSFYKDTQTIYWGNGVRIKQQISKFAQSESQVQLKITVDNMGQQQPFSFSYDLSLLCMQYNGKDKMTISFDEKDFEKKGRYELVYTLDTMAVKDVDGKAAVIDGSFKFALESGRMNVKAEGISVCRIIDGNTKREVINNYYRLSTEQIVKNTFQQSIYLAKISVIKAGSAYIIDTVEKMPLNQYVLNNVLSQALTDMMTDELERIQKPVVSDEGGNSRADKFLNGTKNISTGSEVIDLGIGGTEGQRFFSEKITHNLGLGNVYITLSQAVSLSDDSDKIFGDSDVFEDANNLLADVKLAAKVDVKTGTFVIGAKMKRPTNARKIKVDWIAVKDLKDDIDYSNRKQLMIKPDIMEVKVRESCYFEACFNNVTDKRVKWNLKEQNSGSIDSNGMYTAPNTPGVFEVFAQSSAYPELTASAYILVKETREDEII